jgi:hypothetical protein
LAQALTLGDAVTRFHPDASFRIGLADTADSLANVITTYPILSVNELVDADTLQTLSQQYTPTEFVAATKPGLIRAMIAQQPDCQQVIYLDPNSFPYQAFAGVLTELESAQILLTPHLTAPPADSFFPDEKYLQNVGLFSADFLAFRRTPETDRMLLWWQDRVQTRAQIDFCASLCLDQIWLMHLPALFDGVRVVKNRDWHRALWNWHERPSIQSQPPVWVNFNGLFNENDGLFVHQTRFKLSQRPDIQHLVSAYRTTITARQQPIFNQAPAFGQRPEPPVVRGWRRQTGQALRSVTRFVETLPV